jgi:hypothetical protein
MLLYSPDGQGETVEEQNRRITAEVLARSSAVSEMFGNGSYR